MAIRALSGWARHRLRAGGSGGGGGPTPTLSLDFTSALPAQITFTRSSTSKAIVGGTFTSLTANQPAIESWNGKSQGLRVNGAATNLSPASNALTNATYWTAGSMTNATVSAGTDLGPDGATVMTNMSETTGNGVHLISQTVSGVTAGSPLTFSVYARRPAGVTRFAFGLRIAPQFNNNGAMADFRYDGSMLYFPVQGDTSMTGVICRMTDLGGGLYLCSLTATAVAAGSYTFSTHSVLETNTNGCTPNSGYVGVVGQGPAISSVQYSATAGAASYCDNPTTAGASVAAESAVFNDITWLNTSVGTLVVEHDCFSGTVIGSGANSILPGAPLNFITGSAKTAIAWDATGSDIVNNGGATTAGATPTFGSDIRLLSTSATTNFGHIKSIRYYPSRLTVTQCQVLTAPVSTAAPGSWRVATRSTLPAHLDAATATSNYFVSRVPATIRGSQSKLRVDFANWAFPGIANTNAVVIDGCALERVTGVAETVLFKFGGATAVMLAAGATQIVSDTMLPSQFTGLTQFNDTDVYYLRTYYHVPANTNLYPSSRQGAEANTTFWEYDIGVTAPDQPITATGAITFTGAHTGPARGMCPVLIGVPASGDPKSAFILGDSRVEGVSGGGGSIVGYTFIQKACDSLGIPSLAYCLGGSSQVNTAGLVLWAPYMAYARILIDEMGTNNGNQLLQYGDAWKAARTLYGVDKIVHAGFSPSSTSTDNWATSANQTASKVYPSVLENMLAACSASGHLDANNLLTSASVRDATTPAKWATNGTAFAFTQDGLHQSLTADGLMALEVQPTLAALVMT